MVDIVILSTAKNDELYMTTVRCIQSIQQNTKDYNILVVEQNKNVNYNLLNVTTLKINEPFNYNKFANFGASLGTNTHICIANNDLIFTPNWFEEILKANHPVCSPICPDDKRQKDVYQNEIGTQVGRNLSGWCFVLERKIWEKIGGFDEDFSFWCADNSFVEQLKAINILPMVVPTSKVYHLGSKTLKTVSNRDELTRQQAIKFNRKYNQNLFGYGTK